MPIYSWLAVAVASYTGTNLADDDVIFLRLLSSFLRLFM